MLIKFEISSSGEDGFWNKYSILPQVPHIGDGIKIPNINISLYVLRVTWDLENQTAVVLISPNLDLYYFKPHEIKMLIRYNWKRDH